MNEVTGKSRISVTEGAGAGDGPCPCGSGLDFDACCGPLLSGDAPAATAEALMRSRYSAYVTGQIQYLATSLHPDHRQDLDLSATRRWSRSARWLNLQVVSSRRGGGQDEEGEVEFIATYKEKGVVKPHHERANFSRKDGVWYYVDGDIVKPTTWVHESPKVGRNDPCHCGSGKKYKKCCGR
jgi:SEC-C motif-containing protein